MHVRCQAAPHDRRTLRCSNPWLTGGNQRCPSALNSLMRNGFYDTWARSEASNGDLLVGDIVGLQRVRRRARS